MYMYLQKVLLRESCHISWSLPGFRHTQIIHEQLPDIYYIIHIYMLQLNIEKENSYASKYVLAL